MGKRGSGPPRRTSGKSAVKRQMLLLVEGRKTEPNYLALWRRRYRDAAVTVVREPGTPLQLVERAVRAKQKDERISRRGGGRPWDEVWCMFDIDSHPHLLEAQRLASSNGIQLAISSPCIELWFILHFEEQTAHINTSAAQKRSTELLRCGKALNARALDLLGESYETAKARAQALDVKHEGDDSPPNTNPSSGVWKVVDSIRTTDQTR